MQPRNADPVALSDALDDAAHGDDMAYMRAMSSSEGYVAMIAPAY
jgi:hypothetical protein